MKDRCLVCGATDMPQIFKGTGWCSDMHRKILQADPEHDCVADDSLGCPACEAERKMQ